MLWAIVIALLTGVLLGTTSATIGTNIRWMRRTQAEYLEWLKSRKFHHG